MEYVLLRFACNHEHEKIVLAAMAIRIQVHDVSNGPCLGLDFVNHVNCLVLFGLNAVIFFLVFSLECCMDMIEDIESVRDGR